MPKLVAPTERLRDAWLEAHAEWGPGVHEDGFGLRPEDDVGSPAGFAAWVARLAGDGGTRYRWIVEDDVVLGGIALRHGSGELVRLAGHIGYGLRPAARGRGLGTWALGRMLDEARSLGLDRVVLVCAPGNTASRKTIEHHGGVLTERGTVLRYRIDLGA
ncbi:GNAT family N-acetyltransferase [Amycolatopsis sp., V23-08]|uniref:GNAT family N-acetyltransferase n=1 Tax=Amycolatopsis heterodermiae TaxID=3110235 RepID=A0ABU5R9Y5_9PSEU|nr:GNAT family N-acetyltransferase [Amycolatopsis sp., V23-08]MEA5362449.1 GNAT family N-acetyltransferase [Amycolatopsis sp., V23-08]